MFGDSYLTFFVQVWKFVCFVQVFFFWLLILPGKVKLMDLISGYSKENVICSIPLGLVLESL